MPTVCLHKIRRRWPRCLYDHTPPMSRCQVTQGTLGGATVPKLHVLACWYCFCDVRWSKTITQVVLMLQLNVESVSESIHTQACLMTVLSSGLYQKKSCYRYRTTKCISLHLTAWKEAFCRDLILFNSGSVLRNVDLAVMCCESIAASITRALLTKPQCCVN